MAVTEHIERQVAVAAIVAVEEPAFLMTMQWIIGGIKIERDLGWGFRMRIEEQIDEQRLDGGGKRWTPSVSGLFVPVAAFIPVVGVAWARRASASCRVGAWLAFLAM